MMNCKQTTTYAWSTEKVEGVRRDDGEQRLKLINPQSCVLGSIDSGGDFGDFRNRKLWLTNKARLWLLEITTNRDQGTHKWLARACINSTKLLFLVKPSESHSLPLRTFSRGSLSLHLEINSSDSEELKEKWIPAIKMMIYVPPGVTALLNRLLLDCFLHRKTSFQEPGRPPKACKMPFPIIIAIKEANWIVLRVA